jgi:DNA repair ATPase RecN
MLWFFLLFTVVNAYNKQYILNCLQYTNPYQAISTAQNLLRKTEVCLARVYVVFPEEFRQEMTDKIEECITDIQETEKSKPEYYAIQKSIGEISANVGSSIVDSQHSVEQLVVCADPLKRITNIDVYEETRFETIKDSFISNMQSADTCIHQSLNIISDQTKDIEQKLHTYFIQYNTWVNMTKIRQEIAQQCQQDIKEISERIFKHIVRE